MNKQSCRFWCEASSKINHWPPVAIGLYFLENENGDPAALKEKRYKSGLANYLRSALWDVDLSSIWFQEAYGKCHLRNLIIALLHDNFRYAIHLRNLDTQCPSTSCVLMHLVRTLKALLLKFNQIYGLKNRNVELDPKHLLLHEEPFE